MRAIIEHIVRITDLETGQVLEHIKRDEIQIESMTYRAKKYDFKFRYVQTGKGDMAMGLREVMREEQKV